MFEHAYNGYIKHAYPYDELRPLTCVGHDTWGRFVTLTSYTVLSLRLKVLNFLHFKAWQNSFALVTYICVSNFSYSLTLIDALDTLVVMGNYSEFRRVTDLLLSTLDFDKNINVSVFETNIRGVKCFAWLLPYNFEIQYLGDGILML